MSAEIFLSTPSARRATVTSPDARLDRSISIHALREEGDKVGDAAVALLTDFYPRPPRGGRPGCRTTTKARRNFYPRPPRGGGPPEAASPAELCLVCQSTPAAWWGTDCPRLDNTRHKFLSTPSARRATDKRGLTQRAVAISIHALREEGDLPVIAAHAEPS